MGSKKTTKVRGRPTGGAPKKSGAAAGAPAHRAAGTPLPPATAPAPLPEVPEAHVRGPLVVGIGASAGGLESLTKLLARIPAGTGMAFVFIQHLDPTYPSQLVSILSQATVLHVVEAGQGVEVKAEHLYIIPPNTSLTLQGGRLKIEARASRGQHMPIDVFLRSLAADQADLAVAVVLSGSGSDGALGIEAVKAEGGITLVEDEHTAKFDGMPHSAIATGAADFVLPAGEIGAELAHLGQVFASPHLERATRHEALDAASTGRNDDLRRILALLRQAHHVDFTNYRLTTIKRRIFRRMLLQKTPTLAAYAKCLQERPAELEALYQDVLIKVTRFFRDPEVFEALRTQIFPQLLKDRPADAPIRVWVPGCSTGEEAYSIAICLLEAQGEARTNAPIHVFATDVSESAIEKARLGIYIENIALDVSPERLRRFFVKQEKSYQVTKSIRDSCIFARQDVTRDPPFSKLDLISFRNVMIYLEPPLQRRLIPMFHYALKPGGVLVLGTSETIGGASDLFSALDKKNKVYGKLASAGRLTVDFAAGHRSAERASAVKVPEGTELGRSDAVQKEADRLVMARFAPPGVVINGDMQIIQFRGHTGAFLEPAPGEASLNITKMARDGLALELRAAIHRARRSGAAVRAEGVQIRHDGGVREVAIEVLPLPDALGEAEREPYFLVLFEEVKAQRGGSASPGRKGAVPSAAATKRVAVLEAELASTKDYLQAIIEEQEATNEELQSANEEILSSNEELQSINEELETAKEELQSTNEELTTLNEELGNRNVELTQLNDDLENLFISVNIPIVMLSRDLRIRRFTPMAQKVLNLIPGDVGRSLSDIRSRIDVPDMEQLIADVIDTMSIREREVQDREGHWYSMRIRPYRTTDNKIEGAVICFVDVDMLHRTVEELRKPT